MTDKLAEAVERDGFVPCPTCKQYSHSIGEDQLAEAFMHFQSMYAHPIRGHPMGDIFDDKTRNAAQVLMAAARSSLKGDEEMVAKIAQALMDATAPLEISPGDVRQVPILCADPDFNELPDREHMLADDEFCREDIEALARAAISVIGEGR